MLYFIAKKDTVINKFPSEQTKIVLMTPRDEESKERLHSKAWNILEIHVSQCIDRRKFQGLWLSLRRSVITTNDSNDSRGGNKVLLSQRFVIIEGNVCYRVQENVRASIAQELLYKRVSSLSFPEGEVLGTSYSLSMPFFKARRKEGNAVH